MRFWMQPLSGASMTSISRPKFGREFASSWCQCFFF